MRNTILIFIVACISLVSFSQNNAVLMTIENVTIDSVNLEITLELKNDSVLGFTMAKPDIYYACCNILHIYYEDVVNGEKVFCRPCLEFTDLESISIDYTNGVYLYPHESFRNTIKIDRRYTPYLKAGSQYYLTMSYDFNGVKIKSNMKNIYHGKLDSNRVVVKIE